MTVVEEPTADLTPVAQGSRSRSMVTSGESRETRPSKHGIPQTDSRKAGVVSGVGAAHDDFATLPNQDAESLLQPGPFRLPVLFRQIRRLAEGVGGYRNVSEFGHQLTKVPRPIACKRLWREMILGSVAPATRSTASWRPRRPCPGNLCQVRIETSRCFREMNVPSSRIRTVL